MKKGKVAILTGGSGGVKLAHGFSKVLTTEELTVVVNTADDFEYCGLFISPDIDTTIYTFTEKVNTKTGWGRKDELWTCFNEFKTLEEQAWFQLGDKDLAMHLYRTKKLKEGASLETVTTELARLHGTSYKIVPMSNDPVSTFVLTDKGRLHFQEYFVRDKCNPRIHSIELIGADTAKPSEGFYSALHDKDLNAVIIGPSNPYLSIDPILSIAMVREDLKTLSVPVIAVSPIVNNNSLKGPTAKIMLEKGKTATISSILDHYKGIVDGIIIDTSDANELHSIKESGLECIATNVIMTTIEDRIRLAEDLLQFIKQINKRRETLKL